MLFHQKIIPLPSSDGRVFNICDYSTIIDIDVYKGGYGDYYCRVFYTTPGDSQMDENKKVTLLCVYEDIFIDSDKRYDGNNPFDKLPTKTKIDDKYRFFKSVKIGSSTNPYRVFIYLHEELSTTENRDNKINVVIN